MNPEELHRSEAQTLPALFECSPAPQERTRVRTPLQYHDSSVVGVFVLEHDGEVCVSDLCEALGRLRMRSVDAGRNAGQTRRIEDTRRTLDGTLHRGQFLLRLGSDAMIAEAVRISDLRLAERRLAERRPAD